MFKIFLNAQGTIAPKYISDQVYWSDDTIFVDTTLTILQDGKLAIGKNTVLLFDEGCGIICYGKLSMVGSEQEPIILINKTGSLPPIDSSYSGAWSGITIKEKGAIKDTFNFSYCKFSNSLATIAADENGDGGVLNLAKNHFYFIDNCVFENNIAINNGGAIYMDRAVAYIKNCIFKNNRSIKGTGGAISLEPTSNKSIIEESLFYSNISGGDSTSFTLYNLRKAGAIEVRYSGGFLHILNNIFSNNISTSTIWSSSYRTMICGNIVVNNFGSGYFLGNTYSADLIFNNTIMNNEGRGLNIYSEYAILANNYIIGHKNREPLGGPEYSDLYFYNRDSTFDNVYNNSFRSVNGSLFYFNEDLWKFQDNNFIGEYYLSDTSVYAGLNDNGLDYKWNLDKDSPLKGKGSLDSIILANVPEYDIYGIKRMANGSLDVGAVEIEVDLANLVDNSSSFIKIYPTLFKDNLTIELSDKLDNEISYASVFNIKGEFCTLIPLLNSLNTLNLSKLSTGVYLVKVTIGEQSKTFKVVKSS